MGRKKQPIDLLLLKGNKHLTKKEVEDRKKNEIKVESDKIKPPSYLSVKLKQEFNEYAKELKRINLISNLDVDTLARYVITEFQYRKVVKKSLKADVSSEEYKDLLIKQDKLFKMARAISSDIGLNISSRCKLIIPENNNNNKPPEPTKYDKLFGDKV